MLISTKLASLQIRDLCSSRFKKLSMPAHPPFPILNASLHFLLSLFLFSQMTSYAQITNDKLSIYAVTKLTPYPFQKTKQISDSSLKQEKSSNLHETSSLYLRASWTSCPRAPGIQNASTQARIVQNHTLVSPDEHVRAHLRGVHPPYKSNAESQKGEQVQTCWNHQDGHLRKVRRSKAIHDNLSLIT